MIKSLAVTFIAPSQEAGELEAHALFVALFGEDRYAVGGIECVPYEIGEPEPELDDAGTEQMVRRTLSWQYTAAAHPVS